MVHTRVEYAGGRKKDPTYRSLDDHSETIQMANLATEIIYDL